VCVNSFGRWMFRWCHKKYEVAIKVSFFLQTNIAEILFVSLPPSSAFNFLLLPHGVVLVKIILLITICVVLIILSSGYFGTYCCDRKK
jgi:hypothetical protein